MASNALIALAVIHRTSPANWGMFVKVLILVSIIGHVANWGNRDFLLRQFSTYPSKIASSFYSSLAARSMILMPAIVVLWYCDFEVGWLWVSMWLILYFIYQSFDVIIVYHRRFRWATAVEVIGLLIILLPIIFRFEIPSTYSIIKLYTASYLIRCTLLAILVRWPSGVPKSIEGSFAYFRQSFPFFIIGFSGLLQSKIDLYTISFFLGESQIGTYQILMGFLLAIQAASAFLLTPFAKNIMRVPDKTVRKLSNSSIRLGLILVVVGIFCTRFILDSLYHIELDLTYYLIGAAFALPPFFYLSQIYQLYGHGKEKVVVWLNLVGAGLNMVLTILLIKGLGMLGALIATALVQWGLLISYLLLCNNLRSNGDKVP